MIASTGQGPGAGKPGLSRLMLSESVGNEPSTAHPTKRTPATVIARLIAQSRSSVQRRRTDASTVMITRTPTWVTSNVMLQRGSNSWGSVDNQLANAFELARILHLPCRDGDDD